MASNLKPNILKPKNISLSRSDTGRQIREMEYKKAVEKQLKAEAQRLDKEFNSYNFKTLNEALKYYSQIPQNIKKYMSYNPEKKYKSLLTQFDNKIKIEEQRLNKLYDYLSDEEDYESRKSLKAEIRGKGEELEELKKYYNSMKNNKSFYNLNEIFNYAHDKGVYQEKRLRYKYEKRKLKEKQNNELEKKLKEISSKGGITGIGYNPKGKIERVKIGENWVDTKELNLKDKDIKLSGEVLKKSSSTNKELLERQKNLEKLQDPKELSKFLEIESKKYLQAKPINRKQILNDLIKKYGNDIATRVIESATTKSMSEKQLGQLQKAVSNYLVDIKTGKQRKGLAVDNATLERVVKKQINDELRQNLLKPLKYTDSLKEFEKKYKQLENLKKRFETPILRKTKEQIKKKLMSIEYKALTKQSLTPKEIKEYKKLLEKEPDYKKFILDNYNKGKKEFKIIIDKVKGIDIKDLKEKTITNLKDLKNIDYTQLAKEFSNQGLITAKIDLNKVVEATKEFIPFMSKTSQRGLNNLINGKDLSLKEKTYLVFDLVTFLPLIGQASKGVTYSSKIGGKYLSKLKPFREVKESLRAMGFIKGGKRGFKLTLKNKNILLDLTLGIIKTTGFTSRLNEASKELYNVNEKQLKEVSNKLGLESPKQLYNEYVRTINKYGGALTNVGDYINVDIKNRKAIEKGQKEFKLKLKKLGLTDKEIKKTIENLEGMRTSRIIAMSLGLIRTELQSEAISQRLMKRLGTKGTGKNISVGIGGLQETLSSWANEIYIKGYDFEPKDFLFGVLFGVSGSIYFSKQKLKDIRKKDLNKAVNRLSEKITNKLSQNKKNEYLKTALKEYIKKNKNVEVKGLISKVNKLSTKDKDLIVKNYVKNAILYGRKGNVTIPKKNKFMFRDIVANILDPFEAISDPLYDIGEKVLKKLKIKFGKKLGKKIGKKLKKISKKKTKVKTKTKTKAKTKTKSKSKAKVEVKSKTKTKTKTKTKAKTKAKAKAKAKSKAKAKAKTKAKAKAKAKSKAKAKAKTKAKAKAKAKAKTLQMSKLKISKTKTELIKRNAYEIVIKKGNKNLRIINTKLPMNRAINEARKRVLLLKGTSYILKPKGKTLLKDITKTIYDGKFIGKIEGKLKAKFIKK